MICFLGNLRLSPLLHIVLHAHGVGLVQVRPQIAEVEIPLTDFAKCCTLILVIIAEHAVPVYLPHLHVGGVAVVALHFGQKLFPILFHTHFMP